MKSNNKEWNAIQSTLKSALRGVPVLAWRIWLDTPGVMATVAGLRGAFGKALQDLDEYVYRAVFRVQEAGDNTASPRYIVRPAPVDRQLNPAIDFIVFGSAVLHGRTLLQAWEKAAEFGLKVDGVRQPFQIRAVFVLHSDGRIQTGPAANAQEPWTLADVPWPVTGVDPLQPCRLIFPTVTRLKSGTQDLGACHEGLDGEGSPVAVKRGRTSDHLSLQQVIQNLLGRVHRMHLEPHVLNWEQLEGKAIAECFDLRCEWHGEEFDYQRNDTEIYGCRGEITLPDGPGNLWRLLAAGEWLHVGKNFTEGLGQVLIR
ncbi:MAG: CRISPR system precrRNA processing endoribonuclease RAMP protein Cas6 [Planctomyces sp.]|nr:CRISPR system precrRNA processing endoribonuclease RAMP protein Cas6 [Planctomyces sp.]